jgi:hypothetical protein
VTTKTDNHNNKSDINAKTTELGNGGESEKKVPFSAQNDVLNNLLEYCT